MSFYIYQKSEIKADPDKEPEGDSGFIVGYASKFGEKTAFDNFLKTGKLPKMFFNHDSWGLPVGVWDRLEVDDVGLKAYGRINLKTSAGADLYESIKFGSVDGLSICIRLGENDYFYDDGLIRHITNVQDMREISIVNYPADNNARMIDFKSIKNDTIDNIKMFERSLRDAGFSKSDAMALISQAKRAIHSERDADEVKGLQSINQICKSILEIK